MIRKPMARRHIMSPGTVVAAITICAAVFSFGFGIGFVARAIWDAVK